MMYHNDGHCLCSLGAMLGQGWWDEHGYAPGHAKWQVGEGAMVGVRMELKTRVLGHR